jgi:uncharacterized protein with HEPN domain
VIGPVRQRALLFYIQESITRVENYCRLGRDDFLQDSRTHDAVLRRLETLADAANQLSDDLKARHPSIRWRAIYGFRNVAAHAYLELELPLVWDTIEAHLPALKSVVEEEIARLPSL